MPWIRKRYKDNKVYVLCNENGEVILENGMAKFKYAPEDIREYTARKENIRELDYSASKFVSNHHQTSKDTNTLQSELPIPPAGPEGKIVVYTDGASRGNPGDAAAAAVLVWRRKLRDLARFLGKTTNNVAELTAIKIALSAIRRRDIPIEIHTDSKYVQGVLVGGWKAKANKALIADIKRDLTAFSSVRILYVEGHAGIPGNERADKLCNICIDQQADIDWRMEIPQE